MKLTHLTNKEDKERILKQGFKIRDNKNHFKPNGTWLSIDGEWEEWCGANNFNENLDDCIIKVKLHNLDRYYTIDSLDDFLAKFHEFCAAKGISNKTGGVQDIMLSRPFFDWFKEKGYHGIILTARGQADTRMSTFMYGWDCASVCVFRPEDIEVDEE